MADLAVETLVPISTEINKLMDNPEHIDQILHEGSQKANELASPVVTEAYEIIGLLSSNEKTNIDLK